MADPKHIVRTEGLDWAQARHSRHPFNPASEMRMVGLGDGTGMTRIGVNLIRIPPGKESFIPHAHALEEECVFVLSGAGQVVLDGEPHAVGAGDFVGFPIDGVVHSLVNTGDEDLVYLTAGQRSAVEVAHMPTIGKTAVFRPGRISMMGDAGVEELSVEEWVERSAI